MTTNTSPLDIYEIKVKGQDEWRKAVRTRNAWNEPWTGAFVAYDQDVEDASPVVDLYCTTCKAMPFKVAQRDIDAAGGHIVCEYCGQPCIELRGNVEITADGIVWQRHPWIAISSGRFAP